MAIVVDANTIALYKFNDDPAGTGYATAVDSASFGGTQRNLAAAGEASTASVNLMHIINGPGGAVEGVYARWFPGTLSSSNAYLSRAGDSAFVTLFTGSYTAECWIKPETFAAVQTICAYAGNGETLATNHLFKWYIQVTNGRQEVAWEHGAGVNDTAAQSSGTTLTLGIWQHIAVTIDNSGGTATVKFYLNGALQHTVTGVTKATGGTSATLQVGSGSIAGGTDRCHGALKSLVLRNSVYTLEQIAADAALTTYEHVVDAGTFVCYQFNEAPDAIDESDYGYHLRCIDGSIWRVDPLYPDEGYSAFFDTASEYDGHWGYTPILSAFTSGVWTFDAWIRLNANYNNVTRGFFRWGDDGGTEVQADNVLYVAIETARKINVFEEYGAGTNENYVGTNALFTAATAYNRHHFAVVRNGLNIKVYIDGVQVDSGNTTHTLDGATQGYLRIGGNPSALMSGSMDNARLRNIAATEADLLATFNDGGGDTPNYDPSAAGARRSTRWGVK